MEIRALSVYSDLPALLLVFAANTQNMSKKIFFLFAEDVDVAVVAVIWKAVRQSQYHVIVNAGEKLLKVNQIGIFLLNIRIIEV
jgi:hypothetical protein